ncbi:MAG: nucleotidyltransferase domain-containing protein [Candidatus Woesearchaeota archaeon]
MIDVCLGTRTAWKILAILCESPGKAVPRKEIRKFTMAGNKALAKFLLLMEKFGIITSAKFGKAYYYKLNLSSPYAEKILETLSIEKRELNNPDIFALNELREFVYELTNVNLENLDRIILFGSYAKRTYGKDSDIDVAVILNRKSNDEELVIADIIGRLGKRFGKEIQAHYYTSEEFDRIKGKDRRAGDIAKDGIRLM